MESCADAAWDFALSRFPLRLARVHFHDHYFHYCKRDLSDFLDANLVKTVIIIAIVSVCAQSVWHSDRIPFTVSVSAESVESLHTSGDLQIGCWWLWMTFKATKPKTVKANQADEIPSEHRDLKARESAKAPAGFLMWTSQSLLRMSLTRVI